MNPILEAMRDGVAEAWDKGKLTDKQYEHGMEILGEIEEEYF